MTALPVIPDPEARGPRRTLVDRYGQPFVMFVFVVTFAEVCGIFGVSPVAIVAGTALWLVLAR